MNAIHLLSNASLFKDLTAEHRKAIAGMCAVREVKKRDVLFREGDSGSAFYLLVRGQVQLHKLAPDGKEIVIKVIRPGETFAEVVLFEEPRYPVTATALTDALLLTILKRDLHRLLEDTDFRNDFIAMLMRKQRYLADRIRQLSTADVEERFFNFLRDQYGAKEEIEIAITKKQIAAAIGVTPETLSRLIRKLSREKKIAWTGRRLRLNPARA